MTTAVINARRRLYGNVKLPAAVARNLNVQSKLLDVGCGGGHFLNQIRADIGCAVYGVDMSPAATKVASDMFGIDVYNGNITEAPFSDGSFDVVTAWWYLEHVPNPSEVLQRISELLKQDGCCVLGVPNVDSLNAKVFKDRWYHLDCPRHLYLYSPATITSLMEKAGLSVTKILFDKTPWGLLGSMRYRFGDDNTPLKNRKQPVVLSTLKRLLVPLTMLAAIFRQADAMVVYGEKSDSPT